MKPIKIIRKPTKTHLMLHTFIGSILCNSLNWSQHIVFDGQFFTHIRRLKVLYTLLKSWFKKRSFFYYHISNFRMFIPVFQTTLHVLSVDGISFASPPVCSTNITNVLHNRFKTSMNTFSVDISSSTVLRGFALVGNSSVSILLRDNVSSSSSFSLKLRFFCFNIFPLPNDPNQLTIFFLTENDWSVESLAMDDFSSSIVAHNLQQDARKLMFDFIRTSFQCNIIWFWKQWRCKQLIAVNDLVNSSLLKQLQISELLPDLHRNPETNTSTKCRWQPKSGRQVMETRGGQDENRKRTTAIKLANYRIKRVNFDNHNNNNNNNRTNTTSAVKTGQWTLIITITDDK
ncbi:hypothetical protein AGLY_011456 [Aphis glycines]|uniref:Uncharacterized protein n=1 Tax=Aphis glycines TaxID=307491 RepID=A0A6G0TBS3_APHGL|nr:hypothetical protein AGLY_011456 [Aphis glycines]